MNNTIEYQRYPNANREYKSTLFVMCFKKKEDLLELYNAVNGTDYQDPEDLEITTLDNAIYLTYKNDISLLLGGMLNLYEHQSEYSCAVKPSVRQAGNRLSGPTGTDYASLLA